MPTSGVYEKGNLYRIPIIDLQSNPGQPRNYFDSQALDELTASISKHGVLEPILFRQDKKGHLRVVAGERRVEGARRAGLSTIPAIYVDGNHAEIALVENLLRQDLTVVEEAEALKTLMDNEKYTQEQLSSVIGKARSTIADILTLTRLPEEIRRECRKDPSISRATLLEIARRKQTRSMLTQYAKYKVKLAKRQAGSTKAGKRTHAQGLMQLLLNAKERLTTLDTAKWNDEENNDLTAVLTQVQEVIRVLLTSPTNLGTSVTTDTNLTSGGAN